MKALVFFILIAFVTCTFAYNWTPIGPSDIEVNNIYFSENIPYAEVICTSTGIMLFNGNNWTEYSNANLPATDTHILPNANLIVTLNDNSWSDGIYEFDLNTMQYEVTEYFVQPYFILKNSFDNNFYIGGSQGLKRSATGLNWIDLEYFTLRNCLAMQESNGHLVVTSPTNIALNDYTQEPEFGDHTDLGIIELSIIDEASGLAASRKNENVFWTHNDSGGDNEVYALNRSGEHLGIYTLDGVSARDWEDISICFDTTEREYFIYVGDIGDNGGNYNEKYIYRFQEPFVSENQTPVNETITQIQTITFEYEGGTNHDAETLMTDPLTNDIYIVSKRHSGDSDYVFRLGYPQSFTETELAQEVCEVTFPLDFMSHRGAVGGDISTSGLEILIKSYDHIYYWKKNPGEEIWQTLQNDFTTVPYSLEIQSEAVCWEPDDSGYYTTSEEFNENPARLSFYERTSWTEAASAADNISDAVFVGNELYGIKPNTEASSGLWVSSNYGNHWDPVFSSEYLSSVGTDCDNNVFVGWGEPFGTETGIALYNLGNFAFANNGLQNTNINKITSHPLIDCMNLVCCTDEGVFLLTDYSDLLDAGYEELQLTNYELSNHPNPFNPSTIISFYISSKDAKNAEINIYNSKGQKINTFSINCHPELVEGSVIWNGDDDSRNVVSSGIYYYQLSINNKPVSSKKCVLIK